MQSLLAAAAPYVQTGKATGIRVSTRPDCVDDAVLALLKSYGVTAVELGCQSMDDRVLTRCRRATRQRTVLPPPGACTERGWNWACR